MKEEDKNIKDQTAFKPNLVGKDSGHVSILLSSQRTSLAFQRTRIGTDRTLMSVIRTALSLISFGFTIFQFFHHISSQFINVRPKGTRIFGFCLVGLGILLLILGISYHLKLMYQMRKERAKLENMELLHKEYTFPVSMAFITAILLLIIGIVSITTMFLQYH